MQTQQYTVIMEEWIFQTSITLRTNLKEKERKNRITIE